MAFAAAVHPLPALPPAFDHSPHSVAVSPHVGVAAVVRGGGNVTLLDIVEGGVEDDLWAPHAMQRCTFPVAGVIHAAEVSHTGFPRLVAVAFVSFPWDPHGDELLVIGAHVTGGTVVRGFHLRRIDGELTWQLVLADTAPGKVTHLGVHPSHPALFVVADVTPALRVYKVPHTQPAPRYTGVSSPGLSASALALPPAFKVKTSDGATMVAFSHAGKYMAVACGLGGIDVFKFNASSNRATLVRAIAHPAPVTSLAWVPIPVAPTLAFDPLSAYCLLAGHDNGFLSVWWLAPRHRRPKPAASSPRNALWCAAPREDLAALAVPSPVASYAPLHEACGPVTHLAVLTNTDVLIGIKGSRVWPVFNVGHLAVSRRRPRRRPGQPIAGEGTAFPEPPVAFPSHDDLTSPKEVDPLTPLQLSGTLPTGAVVLKPSPSTPAATCIASLVGLCGGPLEPPPEHPFLLCASTDAGLHFVTAALDAPSDAAVGLLTVSAPSFAFKVSTPPSPPPSWRQHPRRHRVNRAGTASSPSRSLDTSFWRRQPSVEGAGLGLHTAPPELPVRLHHDDVTSDDGAALELAHGSAMPVLGAREYVVVSPPAATPDRSFLTPVQTVTSPRLRRRTPPSPQSPQPWFPVSPPSPFPHPVPVVHASDFVARGPHTVPASPSPVRRPADAHIQESFLSFVDSMVARLEGEGEE